MWKIKLAAVALIFIELKENDRNHEMIDSPQIEYPTVQNEFAILWNYDHQMAMGGCQEKILIYQADLDQLGKWWGSSEEQPILALHGLFDNAASFDLLAPHLGVPALLALDLPGHGFSSHLPKGMCWSWTTMLTMVRYLVKNHFKWSKVSIMGHSYGSCLALTYAGAFSKETEVLITLDCARAANAATPEDTRDTLRSNAERILSLEAKSASLKPLSYKDALQKMFTNRKLALTKEQCEIIATRSLSNIGGGHYIFNEDLRMSSPSIGRNTFDMYDALVANICCPALNFVATDGILIGEFMSEVKKHDEIMKKNCPLFETKVIKGKHHVHMDNPEDVAAAINNFWISLNQINPKQESTISGKWWGDQKVQPILAIHGLSDNCATFDALLPMIDAPSILAIDLPGHGFSSHVAPGISNEFTHLVTCLRYLVKTKFGWPKVDFLCHSFGSCTAFTYTGLFPDSVGKFISLDCARFNMAMKGIESPPLLQMAAELSAYSVNYQPPERTYEEHLREFMGFRERSGYGLSEKSSKIVLKRLLREVGPDKFVETADPRLPLYTGILPISALDELAKRITSQLLSVRFTSGVFQHWRKEAYEKQLDIIKKSSPNLVSIDVVGGHHAHLEDPESLAPHVNSFLKRD